MRISKASYTSNILQPYDSVWPLNRKRPTSSRLTLKQNIRVPRITNPRNSAAPLLYSFTCSSNWKFFSKTRSMWSRKAECSCCFRFHCLPFNMKRKIRQVVESVSKQGRWWDTLLKQNFNNLSQGGLQKKWPSSTLSSVKILQYP